MKELVLREVGHRDEDLTLMTKSRSQTRILGTVLASYFRPIPGSRGKKGLQIKMERVVSPALKCMGWGDSKRV